MFQTEKKMREPEPAMPKHPVTPLQNHTGIPSPMKSYFELSSGLSFDDVRVHYYSAKPAQFQALAYTQGSQIYLGPGQEQHLSHELGHILQQKTGRVKPVKSFNGVPLNDDPKLEQEADHMG